MNEYAITKIGLYNNLGTNAFECWNNLINEKSALHNFNYDKNRFFSHYADNPNMLDRLTSFSDKLNIISLISDFNQCEPPEYFESIWKILPIYYKAMFTVINEILGHPETVNPNTTTIINYSTIAHFSEDDIRQDILNSYIKKSSPKKIIFSDCTNSSYFISKIYNLNNTPMNMDQICINGIASIYTAIANMEFNKNIPATLIINYNLITPIMIWEMLMYRALSNSNDIYGIKPFDVNRNGIALSDQIAGILIEPLEKAIKENKEILAIVKGIDYNIVPDSATSPDTEGIGIKTAMKKALDMSGLKADDIEYINAHATGTPAGDNIEYEAIKSIYPERTVVSNKGQIGHGIFACSLTEIIYTILSKKNKMFAGNYNLETPCNEGLNLPVKPFAFDPKYMVKNSLAFGGRNASIVLT